MRKKLAAAGTGGGGLVGPEDIGGTPVIARVIEDVPAKDLKGLADDFMGQIGSGVVALITASAACRVPDSQLSVLVGVSSSTVPASSTSRPIVFQGRPSASALRW